MYMNISTMVYPSTAGFCSVLIVEMRQAVGSKLDLGGFLLFFGSKQGPACLGCVLSKIPRLSLGIKLQSKIHSTACTSTYRHVMASYTCHSAISDSTQESISKHFYEH